jgi:hypothetical protein
MMRAVHRLLLGADIVFLVFRLRMMRPDSVTPQPSRIRFFRHHGSCEPVEIG